MGPRPILRRFVPLALVLIIFTLGAAGCGGPKLRVADLVGKWRAEGGSATEVLLELRPDGTGESRFLRPPHPQSIRWSVHGTDLVTSAMDGTMSVRYGCRLDGADRLVLKTDKGEAPLVKVK